jgi:class 3 adenylate cyclase
MKKLADWREKGDRILKTLFESPDGFSGEYARFYIAARLTYPFGLIGHAAFLLIFWHLDLFVLAAFNVFSVAVFAYAFIKSNQGIMRLPGILTMLVEIPSHAILATIYTGAATGFWIYLFLSMIFILLLPFFSRKLRLLLSIGLVFILLVLTGFVVGEEPMQLISKEWVLLLFINNMLIFATVLVTVVSSYELAVVRAEGALQEEFNRAESLLLNILPVEIAARLKTSERPLADSHDSVSVLFADLAGFTAISQKMSANELVNLLNDLFSRFDRLAEKHGAEKIKTIGDAYMVATGLSRSAVNHAEKIADLALGMQKAFRDFRQENQVDLKLRIGVHSGAVIAGVIGERKFSYDLWGNTVNIASRMESEGIADQIQISAETRNMLSDTYRTSPRGEISVKGHRSRLTYLLEGYV